MKIGTDPGNPDYIAFKKGILSEKEFRQNVSHGIIASSIISIGCLALAILSPPIGTAVVALNWSTFYLNRHLLSKKYTAREGDIAIEDVLEVSLYTPQEVKLKGDRVISASQEQIEMLVELKEISPLLNYEIIR